jgi:hypothetical protein
MKSIKILAIVLIGMIIALPAIAQKSLPQTDHNGVPLDPSLTDPRLSEAQRTEMIRAAQIPEQSKTSYDPIVDDRSLHDEKLSVKEREQLLRGALEETPSKSDFDPQTDDPKPRKEVTPPTDEELQNGYIAVGDRLPEDQPEPEKRGTNTALSKGEAGAADNSQPESPLRKGDTRLSKPGDRGSNQQPEAENPDNK